ncbi:MAG: hypothetical protein A2790_14100 [Phenylobacterium sp. RIFCSPHIGHO2_01_FULL_69_31]|uniref:DUF885 domain-containing protein n=1 Tax=Phenylobacterium sp. RIFCSPHIGHO2_01_FULL_69_31 TaxID=1801944 RepID=UPI0008AE3C26|nr:DUF885 family protein [Phenylobacterium sp. RIFCSPHIGHO2_01_FULL_69_31]OHB26980.1 MAG: hypothetical protein A2790_14100 [Phenylobacterium sp. RIFCSPHIGHO2_01_FULL_69_31]
MRRVILALMLLLLAGPALADDAAMTKLAADYDAWLLSEDPITAGRQGDRAALSKLPDVTPAADARRLKALKAFQARLATVPEAGLSDNAAASRGYMAWELGSRVGQIEHDTARMPVSSDGGFEDTLNYVAATTPMRSAADAEAWIARLEALPGYYRDNIENARRGIRTGFTQPKPTVDIILARAKAAAVAPLDTDPLLRPFRKLPDGIPAEQQVALRARATAVVRERIRPAQRDFAAFMEREYAPAARKGLGVRTAPGGEAFYRFAVKDFTTTGLSPDEVYALGEREVARIRAQMLVTMKEAGFAGDLPAFIAMLRKDPKFYATSRQDLLEKASEIAKRIDDQLPGWYGTLPRLTYGVRPVPPEIEAAYTTGRYFQGSPEQGVAGGYMVNTFALDQRPLYELPALTAHEAVPGHHLQIALAQELKDVPMFRREGGVTAFVEGWGLYSEKVAGEMGIYRDAYERFGQLSYEMWRACRLVADTGIHWKGWTREQAEACFLENTALAPLNITVEVDRYISWPGQALGYKIGELKFLELRARAKARLGERFDIRRFHDAVLLAGPLPMDLLEARVDAWITAGGR